jgi:gamma-glutamyltranspeptidase / glutathione hydrolase
LIQSLFCYQVDREDLQWSETAAFKGASMHMISRRSLLVGAPLGLAVGSGLSVGLPTAANAKAPSRPAPVFTAGGIASPDRFGAEVGAAILRAGGNAVDAAVAMGFALAVTYPEAGNIGGGGFMTLFIKGQSYFLDYREAAPKAATPGMYLGPDGEVIANRSMIGNQAVGVPGTVAGLFEAHRRFGRLSWATVLAPAIGLARNGFDPGAQMIALYREARAELGTSTNLARFFDTMSDGKLFIQLDLAVTLERIARQGPDGFYKGRTARLIVAQMGRGGLRGLITQTDLAAYRAKWRTPITGQWNGMDVITAPPPSSGGIALMQLLGMKASRQDLFDGVPHNSPQYVHLLAELEKRVFADRAVYLGDPDFTKVPVERLLDPAYIARRAAEVSVDRPSPTPSIRPGLESPQTTHYSVIDDEGGAIANTYTLNGSYGSGVVVEGAGFILNNEMDDFSAKPGVPNQFGVVGGDANAIAPGKRPLSSMTPTILVKDGLPVMALGTPGGSRIITTVFQVLLNVYDHKMSLHDAVHAPRYHHQLLPENTIYTEPYRAADPLVKADLEARGYRFEAQSYNGDLEAVQIVDRQPVVAPEPRGRGIGLVVARTP